MFADAYKRAFEVLKSKPIRLWGLSLLVGFVSVVAIMFSLGFLPIGIAFCMVIECGMTKVYLDGLKGKEVNSDQIFEGCKSGKSFFRIAGLESFMAADMGYDRGRRFLCRNHSDDPQHRRNGPCFRRLWLWLRHVGCILFRFVLPVDRRGDHRTCSGYLQVV